MLHVSCYIFLFISLSIFFFDTFWSNNNCLLFIILCCQPLMIAFIFGFVQKLNVVSICHRQNYVFACVSTFIKRWIKEICGKKKRFFENSNNNSNESKKIKPQCKKEQFIELTVKRSVTLFSIICFYFFFFSYHFVYWHNCFQVKKKKKDLYRIA